MDRKEFFRKSGCGLLAFSAAPILIGSTLSGSNEVAPQRKRFNIEIEIYEVREDIQCHRKGEKFKYPDDMGKLCPWLRTSLHDFLRLMENDVTLTWRYEGTPYEKVEEIITTKDGVTILRLKGGNFKIVKAKRVSITI